MSNLGGDNNQNWCSKGYSIFDWGPECWFAVFILSVFIMFFCLGIWKFFELVS